MNSKDDTTGAGQRVKNNLLTLGSAAVLAVYAAGFIRTRAAAQRFNDASDQRRGPAPLVPSSSPDTSTSTVTISDSVHPVNDSSRIAVIARAPKPRSDHPDSGVAQTPLATVSDKTPAKADSLVADPAAKVAKPETQPPVPVTAPVDTATAPVEKAVSGYKDGTYRGYGTSRHGDIEAAVEIKDGRIAAAYITQCLTRYSCSWISRLPPQVVERQSAEVDYVSGATQSTNAFYYAIVQALAKAK